MKSNTVDDRDDELLGAAPSPASPVLEDAEIVEVIREAFRTEVGEALDEVRIVCRHGIVTLAGDVANETLPQIARRIVEDELGYEIVDRMMVTETPGPVDDPSAKRNSIPEETLELSDEDVEDELSEDILETEEEGLVFVPPSRPVAER